MAITSEVIRESQQLVIDVFKSFREELMESYGKIKHSSKQDGSPVTKLDVKIEQALKTKLADAYPDFGFHGEETDDVEGAIDATWFVDPIDGTRSFMHGLPDCSNMAGLVVDGVTVASVIYHFATDELYTAIRGLGAYRNGESIHINNTVLDDSIVFAGAVAYKDVYPVLSYSGLGMYAPIGASGYEFTRLAQGNIQGVTKLRSGSMLHDDIPGVLLVQEAGGEIVSFEGKDYDYKTLEFFAATPNVAQVVREQYDAIKKVIT